MEKIFQTIKVDAKGKTLGRLATQLARLLMGKTQVSYLRNLDNQVTVEVVNAGQLKFTGKKFEQKPYYHFSGYPGGLRTRMLSEQFSKNPGWVIKKAVLGMLPKNRLQDQRIKRLKISV